MKAKTKLFSAAAVAAMTAVVVPFTSHAGATDTPAFEPDGNAKGSVAFFDSSGAQITGGSNLNNLFAYAEASTAGRTGATKATVFFALPDHTKPDSSTWFEAQESATSTFPNPAAPAPVNGFTNPVATSGTAGADLGSLLAGSTLDSTPGYANIVQIRVKDSGPNLPVQSAPFWETDIVVDQTAGTWQEVYPVNPGGLIVTSTLPVEPLKKAYKGVLTASGGDGKYVWSLASGSLPTGLKLASNGKITGSAKALGTYTFTVAVKDKTAPVPLTGGKTYTMTVEPLTITTASVPDGTVGASYKVKFTAVGFSGAVKWSVSAGTLPAGLKLTPAGVLTGTPTTAGTSLFTIQATDHFKPTPQIATQSYSLTIS